MLHVLYGGKTSLIMNHGILQYFKDMRGTIMKELSAKWLTALYDHVCTHPETIKNGFKDAGIPEVLQNMADQMS